MRLCLSAFVIAFMAAAPASARIWHIHPDGSGDAPTIAAAMGLAASGDVVELSCGVYHEHWIDLRGGVTLRSTTGDPSCATIDADNAGAGVRSTGTTGSAIEGITIIHGDPYAYSSYHASVRLTSCVFADSRASGPGGGVSIHYFSTATVEGCAFRNNVQYESRSFVGGGGMAIWDRSTATVSVCRFSGNSAEGAGGGLLISASTGTATDCVFENNLTLPSRAPCGGGGAAVTSMPAGGTFTFERCTFRGNTSQRGGAVACADQPSAIFDQCLMAGNHAVGDLPEWGGSAVYAAGSAPTIRNCTITGNSANDRGAVFCSGTVALSLINTIVAFNTRGAAIYTYLTAAAPTISCSDLFGNEYGDWVGHIGDQATLRSNFSANPLFCDPVDANWFLRYDSPCAPPGVTGCGLVGSEPAVCGAVVAVNPETWGRIKGAYRQ